MNRIRIKQLNRATKRMLVILFSAMICLQTAVAQVGNTSGVIRQRAGNGRQASHTYKKLAPELSADLETTDRLNSAPEAKTIFGARAARKRADASTRIIVRLSDSAARISIYNKITRVGGRIVKIS